MRNFQSKHWKEEALGKTFVPESPEAALVAETVKRIVQLVGPGKEETLTEIVTIALFDAQEIYWKRANS